MFLLGVFAILWGNLMYSEGLDVSFWGHFPPKINLLILRTFFVNILNYGGFGILTLKLRFTDLPLSPIEITEVTVFFTDGCEHCQWY